MEHTSDLEHGWAAAEEGGWEVVSLVRRIGRPPRARWQAGSIHYGKRRRCVAYGTTPAAALDALGARQSERDGLGT